VSLNGARSDQDQMTLTMADLSAGGSEEESRRSQNAARPQNAVRRVFSPAYKLRIVAEYDSLTEHGARGALLRREGLYQSHIEKWRRARDKGMLSAERTATAPVVTSNVSVVAENRRLRAENARLTRELEKSKAVVSVLGKTYALLEMLSESGMQPIRSTRSSSSH
jgi:transposase